MPWDPFTKLASTAAQIVTDAWTAAWLSVWNAGLWVLRLVLSWMDAWLTPDLSADGPGHDLYQVTFWIAGVLVVVLLVVQLGIAAGRRDGKGLARAGIGLAQFAVLTGGWLAYTVAVTVAVGGLTRSVMEQLLGVTSWNSWQPWTSLDTKQISDAGLATVLGLLGLLMWIAAIGHLLVILARDAALMVLVATGPIAAAGLVNEGTRAWFWKAFRWFHAAVATPLLVVVVTGVGTKLAEGVAAGKTGTAEASVGTMLPGIVLICIAVISPVAPVQTPGVRRPRHRIRGVDAGRNGGRRRRAGDCSTASPPPVPATTPRQPRPAVGQSTGEATADAATTSRVAGGCAAGRPGSRPGRSRAGPPGLGMVARVGAQGTLAAHRHDQPGRRRPQHLPARLPGRLRRPGGPAPTAKPTPTQNEPTDPPAGTPSGGQPATPENPPAPAGSPTASGEAGTSSGGGTAGGGAAGGASTAEAAEVAVVAL